MTAADRKAAKKIDPIQAAKAFRQLAMMLTVDRNEIAPVDRIAKQYKGTPIGTVFARVRTEMTDNQLSFASAFAKHGRVFPKVVTGLVAIGAQGGRESEALVEAARIITENARTGKRVKSAITEPMFTLVLTTLFLFVVLFGIIPQFKVVFDTLGKPLPVLTQILMTFSVVMAYFLGVLAVAITAWTIYWKKRGYANEPLRVRIDKWRLNMKPRAFAELIQTGQMSQLFNNMNVLRSINMSERNALVTVARSTNNWALREDLLKHAQRLELGNAVFGQFADNRELYPPDAGYMLRAGEDSGNGTRTLREMSENYKIESDLAADQFVATVGPLANAAVGAIYMFVMLASYLPVFEMYTSISSTT